MNERGDRKVRETRCETFYSVEEQGTATLGEIPST